MVIGDLSHSPNSGLRSLYLDRRPVTSDKLKWESEWIYLKPFLENILCGPLAPATFRTVFGKRLRATAIKPPRRVPLVGDRRQYYFLMSYLGAYTRTWRI